MLDWLKDSLEKRQARLFVDGVLAWYHACAQVTELIDGALHSENALAQDIGVILDRTDRLLFGLRDTTMDAQRALRKYDPALAHRLQQTSNQIYALRNEVARFLIRAQGPGFPSAGQTRADNRDQYYSQAMTEVGFHARQMKGELDKELASLWADLQRWLIHANDLLNRS